MTFDELLLNFQRSTNFFLIFILCSCTGNVIKTSNDTLEQQLNNITSQSTLNFIFPIIKNVSIENYLATNYEKTNQTKEEFKTQEDTLKENAAQEKNDQFSLTEQTLGNDSQKHTENMGRNFQKDEYSGKLISTINKLQDAKRGEREEIYQESFPEDDNQVTTSHVKQDHNNPDSALSGFYSECLIQLSFPCVQRKMLVYVDRLGRLKNFDIFGDYLTVLRVAKTPRRPFLTEERLAEPRLSAGDSISTLDSLLDYSITRFFYNHAVEVKTPSWFLVGVAGSQRMVQQARALKFSLSPTEFDQGRKKGGGMKMAATMMKMLMLGKGMMIPMMLGMTKMMGMKGIFMGMMSMIMMKMMLLTKLKNSGGLSFGCGGGGGGGGGGCGMLSMMGMGGGD